MTRVVAKVLLWLFVINLGIAFGAGLYETTIVIPRWMSPGGGEDGYLWNVQAARDDNTLLRFWVYATTVPLTVITFANLVGAWRARGSSSNWWTVAALAALSERLLTFLYSIPTMMELTGEGVESGVEAEAMASQWLQFNYLRHALVLIAWVTALKAFALIHRSNRSLS